MKKNLLLTAAVFFSSGILNVYAEGPVSVKTFFDLNEKKRAFDGEIITAVFRKTQGGKTKGFPVPQTEDTGEDYAVYEIVITEKAFMPYMLNDAARLALYNNLAAYSRLSGIRYYSVTDKEVETLIIRSTRIEDSVKPAPVKDYIYNRINSEIINYFKIEDNRFGDTVFKSRIHNEGDNFILKNVSTHSLKKYGFTINEAGEYQFIFFFIYDREAGGYFYYAVQALRIRTDYFQKLGIVSAESFANRLRAMTVHYAGLTGLDWRQRLRVSLK